MMKKYLAQPRLLISAMTLLSASLFLIPASYAMDNSVDQSVSVPAGKVSINNASAEQLLKLKGIGVKKAQAIIKYRAANGKFSSIDDLVNVKGIGEKFIQANKAILSI